MVVSKVGRAAVRSLRLCRHRPGNYSAQRHIMNEKTPAPLFLDFLAPSWSNQQAAKFGTIARSRRSTSSNLSTLTRDCRRSISSTPIRNARIVQNPKLDEDGTEMKIIITPRAAHRLAAIAEKDKNPDLTLRVSVESGGCHGFQYLMKLVSKSDIDASEDTVFEDDRIEGAGDGFKATVVMDEPSLELLKGSSIDYTMELIGSQFKVTGIPGATSSCGCGTSFDIAA